MPDLKTSLDLCTFCPRLCSHTCPVSLAEARETVTPQGKMSALAALQHLGSQWSTAPLYACTGCGACTEFCRHHVEPGQILLEGRGLAEQRGQAPAALAGLQGRYRQRAAAAAEAARQAVPAARRSRTAALAYLPACLGQRADEAAPADPVRAGPGPDAARALRVLDRLPLPGDGQAALAEVSLGCAGYPLYAAGLSDPFRLHAEVFAQEVEGHGTLALSCPACTWLLRTQYPRHGVPLRPRVVHISELLAPVIDRLPIARPLQRAAYHDPCYLGRQLRVYDEPRQVLRRAVQELVEFPRNRAEAACCGGGGLLPLTAPETASAMAADRVAELDGQRDEVIVTACASCEVQLGRQPGVTVLGLLEVLDQAMAPDPAALVPGADQR